MNIVQLLNPKSTVSYLYADNTIKQALEKMYAHGYAAIPVIDRNGVYIGSVSEGDFLWYILKEKEENFKYQEELHIKYIIRKEFHPAVKIDTSMEELLQQAMNQNFVPVIDDRNSFIGIVTRKDVIQYFISKT